MRILKLISGALGLFVFITVYILISQWFISYDISATNFLELFIKELFVPHRYLLIILFVLFFIGLKQDKSKNISKVLSLAALLTLSVALILALKPLARWLVLRSIVGNLEVVEYARSPSVFPDTSASSLVVIARNGMTDSEMESIIDPRISEKSNLIELVGYNADSRVGFYTFYDDPHLNLR